MLDTHHRPVNLAIRAYALRVNSGISVVMLQQRAQPWAFQIEHSSHAPRLLSGTASASEAPRQAQPPTHPGHENI